MNSVQDKMMQIQANPIYQKKNEAKVMKRMGVSNNDIKRMGVSNQRIRRRLK